MGKVKFHLTLEKIYDIIIKEKLSKSKRTVRVLLELVRTGAGKRMRRASPVMGESVLASGTRAVSLDFESGYGNRLRGAKSPKNPIMRR